LVSGYAHVFVLLGVVTSGGDSIGHGEHVPPLYKKLTDQYVAISWRAFAVCFCYLWFQINQSISIFPCACKLTRELATLVCRTWGITKT